MKRRQLVLVTWKDARTQAAGWKPIDEVSNCEPAIVKSVGWVLRKTKKEIVIVSSIVDNYCDGDLTIPFDWTTSIEKLTVKK